MPESRARMTGREKEGGGIITANTLFAVVES